jgi:hypothetical protein
MHVAITTLPRDPPNGPGVRAESVGTTLHHSGANVTYFLWINHFRGRLLGSTLAGTLTASGLPN